MSTDVLEKVQDELDDQVADESHIVCYCNDYMAFCGAYVTDQEDLGLAVKELCCPDCWQQYEAGWLCCRCGNFYQP